MRRWSIVSSMFGAEISPAPGGHWRSWAIAFIALTGWVAASWYFTGRYETGLTESYLRRERVNAERDIHSINSGVSTSWQIAQDRPQLRQFPPWTGVMSAPNIDETIDQRFIPTPPGSRKIGQDSPGRQSFTFPLSA